MVQPPYEVREEKPPRGREPLYGAPYIWRCRSGGVHLYIWRSTSGIWRNTSGSQGKSIPQTHRAMESRLVAGLS